MPRHLAFPLAVGRRGLTSVEQDSPEDIVQSLRLLLSTTAGERRSVPGYGIPDGLMAVIDDVELAEIIGEWEERADLDLLEIVRETLTYAPKQVTYYGQSLFGVGTFGGVS